MSHNRLIALYQPVDAHFRDDVGGSINIISGNRTHHPVFFLKSLKQTGSGRGLEDANHGGDNPAFLNEINMPLKS